MRFYLDLPLFAGYVMMAFTASVGMLQFVAARGRLSGLSLFTSNWTKGEQIGAGLTASALVVYLLVAPEILTPGPAGTEVAALFACCSFLALVVTLFGADLRLKRNRSFESSGESSTPIDHLSADVLFPYPSADPDAGKYEASAPVVLAVPDPLGFTMLPLQAIEDLRRSGFGVALFPADSTLVLNPGSARRGLLQRISKVLDYIEQQPGINGKRVGLLGLGLAGDALLTSTNADRRICAIVAVSPIRGSPNPRASRDCGVNWLHELSYRDAWRFRRAWRALEDAALELKTASGWPEKVNSAQSSKLKTTPPSRLVLSGSSGLTTRMNCVDVPVLQLPTTKEFMLLGDVNARRALNTWFQQRLQRKH